MNKTEYIKQLKRLIKKYHPDLCNDSYIQTIHNEITVKLVNKLNETKNKENAETKEIKNNNEYGLVKLKNQDYVFYKLGIKYYKNIHPNQFYKRNQDTTLVTKTYEKLVSILNRIYISFNLAEYYFQKVADEYPQSPYSEDARAKIQLLKKLYKSYKNITIEENITVNSEKFINEMGLKFL